MERANIKLIRQKSKDLSTYSYQLLRELFKENVEFITPEDPERRGSQCTIRIKGYNSKVNHHENYNINKKNPFSNHGES